MSKDRCIQIELSNYEFDIIETAAESHSVSVEAYVMQIVLDKVERVLLDKYLLDSLDLPIEAIRELNQAASVGKPKSKG